MSGRLYVVSCPIGNMEDITLRALRVLAEVDVIAAEDTRRALSLLSAHDIAARGRVISCFEHNEQQRTADLIHRLQQGMSVALISDAGTPSISDPGFYLVRSAIAQGIEVVPVPGVSAAVAALSVSGMPTDAFVFTGFLPKKQGRRSRKLADLANERATLIFYEAPHRAAAFLAELETALGDRQAVVCREMTKTHEEFLRGPLSELSAALESRDAVKGEITVVVEGAPQEGETLDPEDLAQAVREADCGASELAKTLARQYNIPRRQLYDEILKIKKDTP
ncbi:16S rRNA (cytidine(1402)-2'-O)-methyltransferase [Desulfosudis oleivorans]|uniref:Ribosomal RNA small subunit methyltransferase I n=1 Tax=Desulfosudis oleivorans (strain DSM 6200 / JCM 39069 / Hxd3) TaxID=96561 RepID=A8ZX56_DESOH|nr:16S rRNA (cytidine(1402)-2'-O)-methyltransferase [Desulfosudis oleivorans]ABW66912.1 Uroporphyrin-III C/tetrapyrrole (Corrin/Porphyrin) methyltransferase [Desulfosudis oleivorans Hxd3]